MSARNIEEALFAPLRADLRSLGTPAPELEIRLIEAAERLDETKNRLNDAFSTVDGVASVLEILVRGGVIDEKTFPPHVAGAIRLAEDVLSNLRDRLGEDL